MKITIRHYNETANNVIKKLTKHNKSFVNMVLYNATAYCLEQHLFERGKLEMVFINAKDFIPTSADATLEMINAILETHDIIMSTMTLDIAEFCTELYEKLFKEVDF